MADLKRRSVLTGVAGAALAVSAAPAAAAAGPVRRRAFRLGVNYTPSTRWFHMWEDWREDDLRRDLDDIAALGLDHLRLMLLWSAFQPEPALVSGEKLDRLHRFLDLADAAGLDVEVTVFNGHISARYWTPNWLQTKPKPVNWFTDPAALDAQRTLLTALAERIGRHPRFLGFDLSNEPYYYWDDYAGLFVTQAQADTWARTLCAHAEQVAPGKEHTVGCDRAPWDNGTYFTRPGLADAGNVVAIHPWTSFSGTLETDPLGAVATHNAERLIQVAQAYATDPARRVWIQEDGAAPSIHFSDTTRAQYGEWLSRSIRNAASCTATLGFTWWCSHDVNPALVPNLNPLEYDLGLYTNDRRLKPAGQALKALVAEFDRTPPAPRPRTSAIVVPDLFPTWGNDRFFKLAAEGKQVAFVLQSRASDATYLRARGITELIRL